MFPFVFPEKKSWDHLPSRWVMNKKGRYNGCSQTLTVHFREQRPIRCSPSHSNTHYLVSNKSFTWDVVICIIGEQHLTFLLTRKCIFKSGDLFPFPSARKFCVIQQWMRQSHCEIRLINVARSGFHQTHLIPLCSASVSECFQLNSSFTF